MQVVLEESTQEHVLPTPTYATYGYFSTYQLSWPINLSPSEESSLVPYSPASV